MDLAKLREQFLVTDDVTTERITKLVERLLPFCVVHKNGDVELRRSGLSGREQLKLALSARLVAHKLEDSLPEHISAEDIATYTGLAKNQASARAKECVDKGFAERSARGMYRARLGRISDFLDELEARDR